MMKCEAEQDRGMAMMQQNIFAAASYKNDELLEELDDLEAEACQEENMYAMESNY